MGHGEFQTGPIPALGLLAASGFGTLTASPWLHLCVTSPSAGSHGVWLCVRDQKVIDSNSVASSVIRSPSRHKIPKTCSRDSGGKMAVPVLSSTLTCVCASYNGVTLAGTLGELRSPPGYGGNMIIGGW